MSGYTSTSLDQDPSSSSQVAFLQKPFSAVDLTKVVRSLIEATRRQEEQAR